MCIYIYIHTLDANDVLMMKNLQIDNTEVGICAGCMPLNNLSEINIFLLFYYSSNQLIGNTYLSDSVRNPVAVGDFLFYFCCLIHLVNGIEHRGLVQL